MADQDLDTLDAMAENPERYSKAELGAMLKAAALRIRQDGETLLRVRAEIQLAVKSIDKVKAAAMLADKKPIGNA